MSINVVDKKNCRKFYPQHYFLVKKGINFGNGTTS